MQKRLFIFEPSEHWGYCGGAVCCIATTFEEAVELIKANEDMKDHNFHLKDSEEFKYNDWIMTNQLELQNQHLLLGVIVNNYNYA